MNLTKILRAYLHQMVEDVSGYKAFLLDKDTMRVCSTLYGRTELAEHSLVHIERIDGNDGAEHINLKVSCRSRALEQHLQHSCMREASGLLRTLIHRCVYPHHLLVVSHEPQALGRGKGFRSGAHTFCRICRRCASCGRREKTSRP